MGRRLAAVGKKKSRSLGSGAIFPLRRTRPLRTPAQHHGWPHAAACSFQVRWRWHARECGSVKLSLSPRRRALRSPTRSARAFSFNPALSRDPRRVTPAPRTAFPSALSSLLSCPHAPRSTGPRAKKEGTSASFFSQPLSPSFRSHSWSPRSIRWRDALASAPWASTALIALITLIPLAVLEFGHVAPRTRPHDVYDATIAHPRRADTIPAWVAAVAPLALAILSAIWGETVLLRSLNGGATAAAAGVARAALDAVAALLVSF